MVRATFAGFSTALSALQSSQKRLDITGHNLANMNTIGYTRQELQTSSLNYTSPVSTFMNGSEVIVGFGVHMDKVAQIRDPYLDAQYRSQMDKSGYTDSMQTSLDSLSKYLMKVRLAVFIRHFWIFVVHLQRCMMYPRSMTLSMSQSFVLRYRL